MKRNEKLIESTDDVFHQEIVTAARENYIKLYEEEVQLNIKFNTFVKNYRAAYEGKNTRKNQIIDGSISKKNLSKYRKYTETVKDLVKSETALINSL